MKTKRPVRPHGTLEPMLKQRFDKGMTLSQACADIGLKRASGAAYYHWMKFKGEDKPQAKVSAKPKAKPKPSYQAVAIETKPETPKSGLKLVIGTPAQIAELLKGL